MFTKAFALDLLERVLSTFAQAFLGAYAIVGASKAAAAAGIAAGLSALKCLAATQTGAPDSGSLLPAQVDPPVTGEAGHSDLQTVLLVLAVVGVFLLLLGVNLR